MVKVKYRYFVISTTGRPDFMALMMDKVKKRFGDYGLAIIQTGMRLIYGCFRTRIACLRFRRGPHQFVEEALEYHGQRDVMNTKRRRSDLDVLYVGGSVRSCDKYIRKYYHKYLSFILKTVAPEHRNKIQMNIKLSLKRWDTIVLPKSKDRP